MPRTAAEWTERPRFPRTHYVDARIYSDPTIFGKELETIFARTWILACHESEIAKPFDFRTFRHPSGQNLVLVRGDDDSVRTFYNVCSHRGNVLVTAPSGNARALTCAFHAWTYDCRGDCTGVARRKEGFQDRLEPHGVGLRAVRTERSPGGFYWVNVSDDCGPLDEFLAGSLGVLEPHLTEPLEVFHYQKVRLRANYKLWHETNSEFYHDFLHYFNRVTGMQQPGYFARKYQTFPNGHVSVGSMRVRYDQYGGSADRIGWPGLEAGAWFLVDLFPGMTFNLRTSVLRIDTAIPIAPDEVVVELRGLGLRRDTPAERRLRVCDHNSIWGPFGRNLHEDFLAVTGQGLSLRDHRTDTRWLLHGREEAGTIHDETGLRHYYSEWALRMGRSASDPFTEGTIE